MKVKILVIISLLLFCFKIGFSIYFSNSIAKYNFNLNENHTIYNQLQIDYSSLESSFNSILQTQNNGLPISKSFP